MSSILLAITNVLMSVEQGAITRCIRSRPSALRRSVFPNMDDTDRGATPSAMAQQQTKNTKERL